MQSESDSGKFLDEDVVVQGAPLCVAIVELLSLSQPAHVSMPR